MTEPMSDAEREEQIRKRAKLTGIAGIEEAKTLQSVFDREFLFRLLDDAPAETRCSVISWAAIALQQQHSEGQVAVLEEQQAEIARLTALIGKLSKSLADTFGERGPSDDPTAECIHGIHPNDCVTCTARLTAPPGASAMERHTDHIGLDVYWQDLLDKDDRTSPAEYPDMALITREELVGYLMEAEREAGVRERERCALWLDARAADVDGRLLIGGGDLTVVEGAMVAEIYRRAARAIREPKP